MKRLQQRLINKIYGAKADEDNTVNVKLESPSHDSHRSENGPESSSLSPVRSSNRESEDERELLTYENSPATLPAAYAQEDNAYDRQNRNFSKHRRGRKPIRRKTKRRKKKRKSPKRKKSSRVSPIQNDEYDIREEQYKENLSNSKSPKNKRSPRMFRSRVAQENVLASVTKSPLPIDAYMRATEEKIRQQKRRLKQEKRRFKESKSSLRREQERYIEFQKLERSPLRRREKKMRRGRRNKENRKKKPLYGRAYKMDVRPGATVVFQKSKSKMRKQKSVRHSYDAYDNQRHFANTINMIPSFNSYTNDSQTVMRSKEEYQHQRKLEEKMRKKRTQEIDDRWARQEEEQLIKQLEEQKRIMNLRYKVAKNRLKKRSKIGAIAATTYQPKFTRDTLISMYNSNSSGADEYDDGEGIDDNIYAEENLNNDASSVYGQANNVLNYEQIQMHQKNREYKLKDDEEFLEATSLADLPSDLFNAPSVATNDRNPRKRGGGRSLRRDSHPLSTSLPSGLNLGSRNRNDMEQRSRHSDNQHNAEFTSASNKNRFTNSSNGKLHDVLPNINDVLNLSAANEYNTPIVADLDGEAEKSKVPAGTKLIFFGHLS